MPTKKRYKYTTMKQVGGDDGYQWAVFVNGREKVNGCVKSEAQSYRDQFEKEEAKKVELVALVEDNRVVVYWAGEAVWERVCLNSAEASGTLNDFEMKHHSLTSRMGQRHRREGITVGYGLKAPGGPLHWCFIGRDDQPFPGQTDGRKLRIRCGQQPKPSKHPNLEKELAELVDLAIRGIITSKEHDDRHAAILSKYEQDDSIS